MPARSLAIVLCADEAQRVPGAQPKLLSTLCGRPLLYFAIDIALGAGVDEVVLIVGAECSDMATLAAETFGTRVSAVVDAGTNDASASSVLTRAGQDDLCFVLSAETPLVESEDLRYLANGLIPSKDLAVLTKQPTAAAEEASGPWACRSSFLRQALSSADRSSLRAAIVSAYRGAGPDRCARLAARNSSALDRVDDRVQLAAVEDKLYARIADALRLAGATIRGRPRIDAGVIVEPGATIEDGVSLRGRTTVAAGARIDVGCVLTDVVVAANAAVKPYSVCTQASIGESAQVGPFAHVRADTRIHEEARIGSFVETKNVIVGRGAMANHLAFLGDGELGERSNIGAGSVFCNSDSVNKHRTEVGAGAFVGSACQLVAPVRIGAGAFVATGTTVTQDVPDDALAIARVRQENKIGYAKQLRAGFAAIKAGLSKK